MPEDQKQQDDVNALEKPSEPAIDEKAAGQKADDSKKGAVKKAQKFKSFFNIYLLIFILIVVIVSVITAASYFKSKNSVAPSTPSQQLSDADLSQLQTTDASIGDPKQTLTVESHSIFAGRVLIRDNLDVAGTIKVGGALNLSGLTVAGTSTLDQIQGNKLTVNGDTSIQGQLNVQQNVTVAGGASFGGAISAPSISIQNLQLSGDLQVNRHINATGPSPSKSSGGALGSGGTVSVSGTDTAGTIAINTGGGPSAGCFVTVTFNQSFGSTPHVVVTPVGSAAAGLNFYINRSSTQFSLCTTNAAPGSANFAFDYIVID